MGRTPRARHRVTSRALSPVRPPSPPPAAPPRSGRGPRRCGRWRRTTPRRPREAGTPRQVHPALEHRVEEAGERVGVLRLRVVVGPDRLTAEEHREQGAGGLDDVGDALGGQRVGDQLLQRVRGAAERLVGRVVEPGEGRQPRRGRERVPRQGAGLVDGSGRGEQAHQVLASAEGADGQAAADHLAEGHQVRRPVLALARKPVSTSSLISSAPAAWAVSARKRLKPTPSSASGGTTPMFAGAASVMIAAISPPRSANRAVTASRARRTGP